MHECIYAYMRVFMYAYMHVCMIVRVYVRMYGYAYVCVRRSQAVKYYKTYKTWYKPIHFTNSIDYEIK